MALGAADADLRAAGGFHLDAIDDGFAVHGVEGVPVVGDGGAIVGAAGEQACGGIVRGVAVVHGLRAAVGDVLRLLFYAVAVGVILIGDVVTTVFDAGDAVAVVVGDVVVLHHLPDLALADDVAAGRRLDFGGDVAVEVIGVVGGLFQRTVVDFHQLVAAVEIADVLGLGGDTDGLAGVGVQDGFAGGGVQDQQVLIGEQIVLGGDDAAVSGVDGRGRGAVLRDQVACMVIPILRDAAAHVRGRL